MPGDVTRWSTYDPRARPWFINAMMHWKKDGTKLSWSPVYEFSGEKTLGVTATGEWCFVSDRAAALAVRAS